MLVEKAIRIVGGNKLSGELNISGAKNAVLKQMILAVLAQGKYTITNVPDIADVYYMQEVLEVLGISSQFHEKKLEIASPEDISVEADIAHVENTSLQMRTCWRHLAPAAPINVCEALVKEVIISVDHGAAAIGRA